MKECMRRVGKFCSIGSGLRAIDEGRVAGAGRYLLGINLIVVGLWKQYISQLWCVSPYGCYCPHSCNFPLSFSWSQSRRTALSPCPRPFRSMVGWVALLGHHRQCARLVQGAQRGAEVVAVATVEDGSRSDTLQLPGVFRQRGAPECCSAKLAVQLLWLASNQEGAETSTKGSWACGA